MSTLAHFWRHPLLCVDNIYVWPTTVLHGNLNLDPWERKVFVTMHAVRFVILITFRRQNWWCVDVIRAQRTDDITGKYTADESLCYSPLLLFFCQ